MEGKILELERHPEWLERRTRGECQLKAPSWTAMWSSCNRMKVYFWHSYLIELYIKIFINTFI